MAIYTVRYSEISGPPTAAFPSGRFLKRPLLSLTLRNGTRFLSCFGIVDSGADYCVFPRSFMELLGIDPSSAFLDKTSGVASANVPAYFGNIILDFKVFQLPVYAGFTIGLDHLGIGLLGQNGFFENLRIAFDYGHDIFVIETLS